MPVHDDLGIRMKTYEKIPRTRLEKKSSYCYSH